MKLSFNASKKPPKPAAKPLSAPFGFADAGEGRGEAPSSSARREEITQFEPSDVAADGRSRLVIPPKPNEWRPSKKMKNLDLPFRPEEGAAGDLSRFQSQSRSLEEEANAGAVSYGLTVRRRENADEMSVGGEDEGEGEGEVEVKPEAPEKSGRLDDSGLKLREELAKLGDDPGYEDMPVEEFAAAYLRGYGWQEGKGVGKNAKEDVPIRQIEKRGRERFGLGFEPQKPVPEVEANGRDSRGGDGRFRVGKEMRIVGGSREDLFGLKGTIVEVVGGGESVILNLSRREEEVKVRIKDLAELGSAEEEKFLRKMKELRIKNDSSGSRRKSGDEVKRDVRNGGDKRGDSGKVGWLMSHIRVRVISKNLKGGRLYLKKGRVVDVVGPKICDILMDESKELIQGVDQDYLETALPKRGGPVFVLSGRYKGVHGSLVDRDSDRETGVVRDADSQELFNVRLDQIAEYVGDPSLIGY